MITKIRPNSETRQNQTLQQVALLIARGAELQTYQEVWESLVADLYTSDANMNVDALVQSVIRESYVQSTEDLQSLARKVDFYNTIRGEYRKQIEVLRTLSDEIRQEIDLWEDKLNTVGDDAQLANVDLQNALQKQQQTLQMLSNISKMLSDTAMAVIRKLGG